jgi:hypothetical protein
MPLKKGGSRKVVSANIKRLMHEKKGGKRKYKQKQAVAIAMNVAGKSKNRLKSKMKHKRSC